jgi:hypothetical protein
MTVGRQLSVLAVLLSAMVVAGCDTFWSFDSNHVTGSGNAATHTREVESFTSIELAGVNDVTDRVGPEQSVRLSADDNLLDRITTDVTEGRLVIDDLGSFTTKSPMTVEVTMPSVNALTISGSGVVRARGTAERVDAELSGAGDLQLGKLSARDVNVVLSGTGRITVRATGRLDAALSGVGQVTRQVTGVGVITQG